MGKDFKSNINPALQFISETEVEQEQTPRVAQETTERKSKRFNCLLMPSLYEAAAKIATVKRSSVNDTINELLQKHIEDNADLIKKYDEFFGGIESK